MLGDLISNGRVRMKFFVLSLALVCASALGQDSPTQNQPQQKAPKLKPAHRPTLSVEPGRLAAGTLVSLSSSTPNAKIYYTTEGWIPSAESTRYTGPIPIVQTTHLQAIALAPNMAPSRIASASYSVDGPPVPKPDSIAIDGSVLHSGTELRLVTNSETSSKTAQPGDKISVLLDEDLRANGQVLARKGTPVDATISSVSKPDRYGMFGTLGLMVHSFSAGGTTIPLRGGGVVWGATNSRERIVGSIPFVDAASGHMVGNDATIKPGMVLEAKVAEDTPLTF
jgi:hypothetical protein